MALPAVAWETSVKTIEIGRHIWNFLGRWLVCHHLAVPRIFNRRWSANGCYTPLLHALVPNWIRLFKLFPRGVQKRGSFIDFWTSSIRDPRHDTIRRPWLISQKLRRNHSVFHRQTGTTATNRPDATEGQIRQLDLRIRDHKAFTIQAILDLSHGQ